MFGLFTLNSIFKKTLRRPLNIIPGVFLLFVLFAFGPAPRAAAAAEITSVRLLQLTNDARGQNGLPPLQVNHRLTQAAFNKARDLLARGYFAHTTPDDKPFYQWIAEAGYNYLYAGENLAIDFTASEPLVSAWLASPTHRANIMNERYGETGLAVAAGKWQDHETIIAVQLFGTAAAENNKPAPTVLGRTLDLFGDDLNKRKKDLAEAAAGMILLPSLGGRKYLDIIIRRAQIDNLRISRNVIKDLMAAPNKKFVQEVQYQTLPVEPPCCGQETGLIVASDIGAVTVSAPISYPGRGAADIKSWPVKMPGVSGQIALNLFLASVALLLLLSIYKEDIKFFAGENRIAR